MLLLFRPISASGLNNITATDIFKAANIKTIEANSLEDFKAQSIPIMMGEYDKLKASQFEAQELSKQSGIKVNRVKANKVSRYE